MTTARPISENVRREIQTRAYQIWEREGRPHGREREHWLLAETEVLGPGKKAAHNPKSAIAGSTAATAGEATAKSRKPATASKAAPAEKAKSEKTKKSTKGKTGKPA